jgi:(p)ppGpp synthase/HD superfamily hydrolase
VDSPTAHSYDFDKTVEKAIVYLARQYERSGRNPKPVVLHSVRVGLFLYRQGYDRDLVTGAILHDVLEDTDAGLQDVEEAFGADAARLVSANTFDVSIADKYERDREMLRRCREAGKRALIIKAADILDNSHYFRLKKGDVLSHRLMRKMKRFLALSAEELADEPVWRILKERFGELAESSGIDPDAPPPGILED